MSSRGSLSPRGGILSFAWMGPPFFEILLGFILTTPTYHAMLRAVLSQPREIGRAILAAEERFLAAVAALADVVRDTGEDGRAIRGMRTV